MTTTPWAFSGDITFAGSTVAALFDSGPQANIASLSATVTVTDVTGTSGGGTYGIYCADFDTGSQGPALCVDVNAYGGPVSWPFSGSPCTAINGHQRGQVLIYPRGGPHGASGFYPHTIHVVASGTMDSTLAAITPCVYGTRPKSGGAANVLLTLELLASVAAALAAPWLLVFLIPAAGITMDVNLLCSGQMPVPPNLKTLDKWTPADAFQFVQAALWNSFCECVPATGTNPPAVRPPDLTAPTPPGGTFVITPTTCDNEDLCTMLSNMSLQIASLQQQFAALSPLVTLIQRQKVPFAYLPGAIHSGLTGTGEFPVQGVLGLSVHSTSIPGTLSSDMAPVQSWFKLGELSWGTDNGWLGRRIVTHNPHLFLDIDGDVSKVAYQLEPGVTADILELVREP